MTGAVALAATTLLASPAHASNYPPDYPVCSIDEYRYTGPFTLIQDLYNPYSQRAALTVAYDGYLRDDHADDEITIWIRLNGNDAFVPASPGTYDDAYILLHSGPHDCVHCWTQDCLDAHGLLSAGWICQDPTEVEQHLFYWAFNGSTVNAWDIELAAEAGGQWDSNWGANYYARFEQRNGCS